MASGPANCGCGGDEKAPQAKPRPTLLGLPAGPQLRAVGMAAAKAAASNGRHALVEAGQRPVQIGPVARIVPGASRQRPHVLENRPDLRSPFGVEPLVVERAKTDGGDGANAGSTEPEAQKAAVGPDVAPFRGPRHTLAARPSALDPFGVEALIARNTATKSAGLARPQSVGRATLAAATSVQRGPPLPASHGPRPHQLARRPGGTASAACRQPSWRERYHRRSTTAGRSRRRPSRSQSSTFAPKPNSRQGTSRGPSTHRTASTRASWRDLGRRPGRSSSIARRGGGRLWRLPSLPVTTAGTYSMPGRCAAPRT